jgi:hypothetical protein
VSKITWDLRYFLDFLILFFKCYGLRYWAFGRILSCVCKARVQWSIENLGKNENFDEIWFIAEGFATETQ